MHKALSVLVLLSLAASSRLLAQPSNCTDGVVYDDGVFESGDGLNASNVARGGVLQLVEAPSYPSKLQSVCVCWIRTGSTTSIDFDLAVWSFTGGVVGSLVAIVPNFHATGVTTSLSGSFTRLDLSSAGVVINGPVLVGPIWRTATSPSFFVCADQTAASNKLRLEYISGSSNDNISTPLGPINTLTLTYALGIRPVFGPPGNCIPSATALCLNSGRFKVEATFTAPGQPQGTAQVVKLTDETGYLWFFASTNVEAVIKVLDACSFNQRFWVYAGGLTDVQVTLTVTDTKNGTVKTYQNPQGTKFQPIQDSSAFETCP